MASTPTTAHLKTGEAKVVKEMLGFRGRDLPEGSRTDFSVISDNKILDSHGASAQMLQNPYEKDALKSDSRLLIYKSDRLTLEEDEDIHLFV